ncbi:MAG: nucleotidyltransferase family protein [Nitrospiraceae bacterium]|nr:nucleotidyltransferase family protein [Nitrospiraceae bacterium]
MTKTGFLAEEELLLALAKPHPIERDIAQGNMAMARSDFHWDVALGLARAHWVLPMLAWNLQADVFLWDQVPKPVRTELGVSGVIARQRRSLYHAGLAPVFEAFQAQSIPFVLMKGAVVMETVYPNDTRLLNDLDLLVPLAFRSSAVDIFLQNGFSEISEAPDPVVRHQLSLVKGRGVASLAVDLHWDVYPEGRPFHFDVDAVMKRARLQPFGNLHILGMSPEDTFVHYATQLVNDMFRHPFVRLCDLYGLLRAGLDLPLLVKIAGASGATGITHTALKAVELLGGSVPPKLLNDLVKGCPGCDLATDVLMDSRWVFGSRQIPWGVTKFLSAQYFPDLLRRRRYWFSLFHTVYGNQREMGYSTILSFFTTSHAMVSAFLYGGLIKLGAFSPLSVKIYLYDLLWRKDG